MALLLNEIIAIGDTTAHRHLFDADGIDSTFIAPVFGISCLVAEEAAGLLGFQALEWSDPDWPGEDVLPADGAIIATFVGPRARKRSIGRALFAGTARMVEAAGVRFIDATI